MVRYCGMNGKACIRHKCAQYDGEYNSCNLALDRFFPIKDSGWRRKKIRVTPRYPAVEIRVTGNRDPRGPDNSIFVWLEEDDTLHIMTYKANRCYRFREVIDHFGSIEIVQE